MELALDSENVVTVSGHPGDEVHPKTLKSVLKQGGLETSE
jgi:predicted RNA binding protein YcfA (HicA-like mRNA interferase family)